MIRDRTRKGPRYGNKNPIFEQKKLIKEKILLYLSLQIKNAIAFKKIITVVVQLTMRPSNQAGAGGSLRVAARPTSKQQPTAFEVYVDAESENADHENLESKNLGSKSAEHSPMDVKIVESEQKEQGNKNKHNVIHELERMCKQVGIF